MINICLDEAPLFLDCRIAIRVTSIGCNGVVIIVSPFGEMVCKFEAYSIGSSVFKIDDNQLLMLVGGLKKRRFLVVGANSENVAILGL